MAGLAGSSKVAGVGEHTSDDEVLCDPDVLEEAVRAAVSETEVVDVHTHLFPHTHSDLYCWGIDALLTYHYLVSEFFMNGVAPESVTHESFAKMTTKMQADLVWEYLFIKRSPTSEACRGVLTTLNMLGLSEFVAARDLRSIRVWFDAWRGKEKEYTEVVFKVRTWHAICSRSSRSSAPSRCPSVLLEATPLFSSQLPLRSRVGSNTHRLCSLDARIVELTSSSCFFLFFSFLFSLPFPSLPFPPYPSCRLQA